MKKIYSVLTLLITISFAAFSQGQVLEASKADSKIVISGTSTIHDWDMNLTDFRSNFRLVPGDNNEVTEISDVVFSCRVKNLDSENSLMNKKTYEALRADESPEIKFVGSSVTGLVSEGENISGTAKGKLTIAGVTNEVSFPFTGTYKDGKLTIDGSAATTLHSFNIDPPTAMLGSLKTGDNIKISFNLNYITKQ